MAVKRTITHPDLDGNEVSEDWYFSLGKTDALEMDLAHHENVEEYLAGIMKSPRGRTREILDVWKQLLFNAVGQREGNMLVKDADVLRKFRYSGAYEQFLGELLDEDDAGASFFVSIMPTDVQDKIAVEQSKVYTKDDLLGMSDEEFARVAGRDENEMTREHLLIHFQRRTNAMKVDKVA